jgi:hypothetical protein
MHEAFWYTLIEPAEDIRRQIDSLDTGGNANTDGFGPKYWAVIWEIATIETAGSLENLARRIQKFVFPVIRETNEQSELVRQLEMVGEKTSLSTPLPSTTTMHESPVVS